MPVHIIMISVIINGTPIVTICCYYYYYYYYYYRNIYFMMIMESTIERYSSSLAHSISSPSITSSYQMNAPLQTTLKRVSREIQLRKNGQRDSKQPLPPVRTLLLSHNQNSILFIEYIIPTLLLNMSVPLMKYN